ncbi:wd-repeat protein [Stylonychia lemnae]|uniref:Wd-repeat protein n=1 Tax=Stylonychia lemnae TaxID=5949 RepID=A0A077ZVN7_STYLE|nr:wd-repeat protein [Stylonychia lemnae]|eukprot:CDW74000.1 wd-repeat protein [Stylonychia lemnae]
MNFSDPIPQSACHFSNQGNLLAIAKSQELYIFETEKLSVRDKFVFKDVITSIEWSPDDNFIMAVLAKQNQIHLRCLNPDVIQSKQEGWTGKIEEGVIGLAGQIWAPDSRQILTFSDLQLRATVWSLVEQRATAYIRSPKHVPPKGISFSQNKKFMALAERRDAKDWISIYYTGNDWKLVNTFEVDTFDLTDLMWAKEDTSILVYDTPLESKLIIYSAMTGEVVAKHNLSSGPGLGIKSVQLSPNGIFMTVAFFDTKLRIFNAYSQREIVSFEHTSQISFAQAEYNRVLIYRETQITEQLGSYANNEKQYFQYKVTQAHRDGQELTVEKFPMINKKEISAFTTSQFEKVGTQGPPTGVSLVAWSHDSKYLATKCDQLPNVIYVWEMSSVELHSVLVHLNPVKHINFGPTTHQLCISTGQARFFSWSPQSTACYDLNGDSGSLSSALVTFSVQKVKWNPKGNKLILIDKNQAMIAFPGYEFVNYSSQPKFISEYNSVFNVIGTGTGLTENNYNSGYFDQSAAKFLQSSGSFAGNNKLY